MAACATVLQTPELLEAIILELDWQTIITAQRTCKQWRKVIQASPNVRDVIFLPMNPTTSAMWTWKATFAHQDSFSGEKPDGMLNPIAHRILSPMALDYPEQFGRNWFINSMDGPQNDPVAHSQMSWKKMQVISPPIGLMELVCTEFGEEATTIRIENETGVTVGELVTALAEHWTKCEGCPVGDDIQHGDVTFDWEWKTGADFLKAKKGLVTYDEWVEEADARLEALDAAEEDAPNETAREIARTAVEMEEERLERRPARKRCPEV